MIYAKTNDPRHMPGQIAIGQEHVASTVCSALITIERPWK
jgi:hypothetical protein